MNGKSIPLDDVMAVLPADRRARIKARADQLIAEEYTLRDLRRAKQITQAQVAATLDGKQVYISRLERRADMKLSTLRGYIRAIGGDLQLMVTFPEGQAVKLRSIGDDAAEARGKGR